MKKYTLTSLVITAFISHPTFSKETDSLNSDDITPDLIHSLVSIKSETTETEAVDFTDYDDSNWMAIVDLVQAAELQLLYTASL